jgi:hypothetical protein
MTVYRKFLRMRCVKVVIAIKGNCYTGWGETSVSEGVCFATVEEVISILAILFLLACSPLAPLPPLPAFDPHGPYYSAVLLSSF